MVQQKQATDPLARDERHRHFGPLLEFSPDAIVIVDADGRVREWNPAAEPMFQMARHQAVRWPLRELLSTPHRESFDAAWLKLLAGDTVPRVKVPQGMEAGSAPKLDITVAPIRFGTALAGAVVIFRDPTSQVTVEVGSRMPSLVPVDTDALAVSVTVRDDGLAGLPDRAWLQHFLSEPPGPGMERGIAVFDIEAFAMVTSTYGPDAADAVLVEFGQLLKSLDTPGAFAHWRADSFVWVADTADPASALNHCVSILRHALEEPFLVGTERVWLTLSVGLATSTLVMGGDILAAASDALQSAKRSGGLSAVYYDPSMEATASSNFRLANDLHHAITHDELLLHYQPMMDIGTNEIVGVEALVRWQRPGVGLLAPASFIDAAERTGQIVPLGNWVVRTACNNAMRLGIHSGGPRTMSINISARQLRDPGLIATLREAMIEGKCAPATIVIEVTESVLLHDLETVAASFEAIKALDVGLDLDDFGTGYSSLQYLRNLPIDRVKVDQSFVAGLGLNVADTAIVASTIALAHALDLKTIAEGVETTQQLALLREMGCDFAQGYLLSRPTDMETFTVWLDAYVPEEVFPKADASAARLSVNNDQAVERRDKRADRRDEKADRRDLKSSTRETKANARDATASTRDSDANDRDAEANTRDLTANSRDTEANSRDSAADGREETADERDRVADLRDAAASERELVEDDRELARGDSSPAGNEGASTTARRAARQDRHRAAAERLIDASDREKAGQGRYKASAERTSKATDSAPERTDPASKADDA